MGNGLGDRTIVRVRQEASRLLGMIEKRVGRTRADGRTTEGRERETIAVAPPIRSSLSIKSDP